MSHAITRTGTWGVEYDLYIWSFVFVSIFILLNILLAILVEAYTDIASASYDTNSIVQVLAPARSTRLHTLAI
jgi:hypothetical protein